MEDSFTNKRLPEFDVAKGIAIICVILGHLEIWNIVRVVYTFHMPIFFLISGYFLSCRKDIMAFIRAKVRQLIVPYYITCLFICLFSIPVSIIFGRNVINQLIIWICGSIYGSGAAPGIWHSFPSFIGALWFLLALFWGSCIVRYVFENHENKLLLSGSCIVIISYVGWATAQKVWLPFSIQAGMMASGFIFLGYLARRYSVLSIKYPKITYLFLIGIVTWCIKFYKNLAMVNCSFENGFMDILGALAASFLILKACQWIIAKNILPSIINILAWYGRYSIIILAFHIIELDLLPWKEMKNLLLLQGYSVLRIIIFFIFVKILWSTLGTLVVLRIQWLRNIYLGDR